jgi:hypothetical protein
MAHGAKKPEPNTLPLVLYLLKLTVVLNQSPAFTGTQPGVYPLHRAPKGKHSREGLTMRRYFKTPILPMTLLGASLLCGYGVTASAATYVDSGGAAGAQCETVGGNDSAQLVGNCSSSTVSANSNPWYAATLTGPQQVLPPLVNGQPCTVSAIANNGLILGSCTNAINLGFAVLWSAATPSAAPIATKPLPGTLLFPLLRPADVQTVPTALNQLGTALAQSISAALQATVVLYTLGNATPRRVSNYGDNCFGVDVNNTLVNGSPSVVMNCPGTNATPVPTVATWSGSAYVLTNLAVAPGASYCWAVGMNDQLQVVGTCVFSGTTGDVPQTAFWPTPSSAPLLLTMPLNAQNYAVAINNSGHVLAYGNDPTGVAKPLFWPDPSNSFSVQSIQPLPGSIQTTAAGFADNDTVALNCLNASQYPCGGYWTPATGTVEVLPLAGGLKSGLNGISRAGALIYGSATDAAKNSKAVGATLP